MWKELVKPIVRNFCLVTASFLLGSGCAAAQPSPPEKDALIDTYEGVAPELTRYALDGHFEAERPFGLEIALQGQEWIVRFRLGKVEARTFALPSKKYPSLHFERVFVVTRSRSPADPYLMVVIPFGEPQTDCFLNGEDVFRQIILYYDSARLASVEERVFEGCTTEWRRLPLPSSKR